MKRFAVLSLVLACSCVSAQPDVDFDNAPPALADNLPNDVTEKVELPSNLTPEGQVITPPEAPIIAIKETAMINGQIIHLNHAEWTTHFYEKNNQQWIWNNELKEKLLEALHEAENDALPKLRYHYDLILDYQPNDKEYEYLLTDAYLSVANDLANGFINPNDKNIHPEWNAKKVDKDELFDLLLKSASSGEFKNNLLALNAWNERYQKLREQYIETKFGSEKNTGFLSKDLKLGMTDPEVLILREKLGLSATSDYFDEELEKIVKNYQEEKKLVKKGTGLVAKKTRDALNGKPKKNNLSADKIKINMERQRWLPQELGSRHIIVNIPQYEVRMYENGKIKYESRAVIGRPDRQTPAFVDKLRHVVMSPTWTVPPTILKDKIEKNQVSSAYDLVTNRGKYVGPAGSTVPAGHTLRMKSNPANPLGKVKFLFPNKHAIYLHDTPKSGAKFGKAVSSGCVRLEKPVELANLLLKGKRSPEQIKDLMNYKPKEQWIDPAEPVPIYLVYWTIDFDITKTLGDVYSKDKYLINTYNEKLNKYLK